MVKATDHKACNWCGHLECGCKKETSIWNSHRCDCFMPVKQDISRYPAFVADGAVVETGSHPWRSSPP